MLRTYLHIPQELNEQIEEIVLSEKISKSKVIRDALKEGITVLKKKNNNSANALLDIANIARKNNASGPSDLSANLDEYLWGEYGK